MSEIQSFVESIFDELVAIRRDIHAHPEVGMTEVRTSALIRSELEKMGVVQKSDVLASHRERVKKAYPAYFDTYDHMDEIVSFLNGFENLYCVGRNGQHRYNNMDHSMLTALTASQLYRSGSSEKAALWNINTEESYHEDKDEK